MIATAGVLAAGCALVLWQQSRVAYWERQLDSLNSEAARRGIPLRVSASAGRRMRGVEDRNSAHQVRKLEELLERVERLGREGGKLDDGLRAQVVHAAEELMALSPYNLRKVLNQLRENPAIDEETKVKLIGNALTQAAGRHPEEVLHMVLDAKDLFKNKQITMTGHLVGMALRSWSEDDPQAAVQWLKANGSQVVGKTLEEMQWAVLGGAASNDPAAAFRLLSDMGIEASDEACEVIASAGAETQENRERLIKAMRGYVEGEENERTARKIAEAVMESVGRGISKNSFAATSQWLDSEGLAESEIASFAQGLSWYSTGNETGQWLDWIAKRLPADKLAEPVEGLVGDWVEADYLAAGKWLTALPDGSVKTPAVKAYAEAVAAYDPVIATQWAMTITDVDARRRTLQAIHDNWPGGDEAGAVKFAAEHGLD